MKRRIVGYAPAAAADLEWIYDTIADASDALTASRYEARIRAFCDRLEYAAERGQLREDLRPDLRIIGFAGRVTIAFAVEADRVSILRIFYGGRDWEEDF